MEYTSVISIKIVEAKDLVAADRTGTSDPYVIATLDKQKQTTKMIEKTLNPSWNESFNFYLPKNAMPFLRLSVFDYDQYSNDDALGDYSINLKNLEEGKAYDEWVTLKNAAKGELHLEYTFRSLDPEEEINVVYAEDDDDPELKTKQRGESYWPLKGSVYPPSNWKTPEDLLKTPSDKLQLEYIYGYRGHDGRENLHYTANGCLAYHAAAVGIVHDPVKNTQKFYVEHDDDIVSMAIHPNGEIAATGQVASKKTKSPKVLVWSTTTLETLAVLEGFHERSVCSLGFSPDGTLLLTVGTDDKNSICVYDWKQQKQVASSYGSSQKIFLSKFFPNDNTSFVTCGVKHIKFWKLEKDGKLNSKDGTFKRFPIQSFTSLTFNSKNEAVAGAYSGDIYFWKDGEATAVITEAHKGPVYAMLTCALGVVSTGKDGMIHIWPADMNGESKPTKSINLATSKGVTTWEGTVGGRALAFRQGSLVVGTKNSEIFQVNPDTDEVSTITSGHFEEFWGIAAHPTKPLFVTAGKDKSVRLWDNENRKLVKVVSLEDEIASTHIHPSGSPIAVGTENGKIIFLDENLTVVQTVQLRDTKIDDLKFSPDGNMLAAACHNSSIDVYMKNENGEWKNIGTCKGHSSSVTHLDWSEDSKVLQSDSGSYEHLFWDIEDLGLITKTSAVRNVKWATWTCILGWSVKGIWPKGADGTDINATCRSNNGRIVATSDDFGEVKIFKFPCIEQGQKFRGYGGHSSHVTNVRFTANDSHLISTGGNDRTIFQWKVIEGSPEDAAIEITDKTKKVAPGAKGTPTKTVTQPAAPGKATKPADGKTATTKPGTTAKPTDTKTGTPTKKPTTTGTAAPKTPTTGTASPSGPKKPIATTATPGGPTDKDRIDRLEKQVEELQQLVKSLMNK